MSSSQTDEAMGPLLNLTRRFSRASSRAEIVSVGLSPSNAAYAIYPGGPTGQFWIDIFDIASQRGYTKITGPQASFCPQVSSSNNRMATLRDWTVQLGGGVEYHHSSTVMIRDFTTGKTTLELKEAKGEPVVWSPDGRVIAAAEGTGRMGTWDARTGARLGRVLSHIDSITHAAFTSGLKLVTLSKDGTLRVSHPGTSKTLSRLEIEGPMSNNPRALAVSPDGKTVVSVWGTTVHVWFPEASHLTSYNLNSVRRCEGWPLCISPDCRYLVCRTEDGFDIMDVASGSLVCERSGGFPVTAGEFSVDGKVLLLGRMNGDVEVWDVEEKRG